MDYQISCSYFPFYENVFLNFLQNFICKVFVTDDVLSFIGAPELMEIQNQINQLYFKQDQEAALNSFRDKMLTMGISIIEHSDLFVGASPSNEEMHLARFRFKEDDEDFVSDEELHRELGDDYISPCSQLIYEADRQAAKQRILERRFSERIPTTPIMMHAPGVAKTFNLIDYFMLNLYYIIFIAPISTCLHPLDPSSFPNKNSLKMGIVDECTTITMCNLSYNFVIF